MESYMRKKEKLFVYRYCCYGGIERNFILKAHTHRLY